MTRLRRPLPLFALALGLATLGCGGTPTTPGGNSTPPPASGPPKAEVRGDADINAGDIDYAKPRDFTFTVANTGDSPLELKLTRKSCSCAEVKVPAAVAPGDKGNIVVHWAPYPGSLGAVDLAADVQTNDPKNKSLRFRVNAQVKPLVRVVVEGDEEAQRVDFGDRVIEPGEKRVREVKVFSTTLRQFDLRVSCTVPGFDVHPPTPLPAGTRVGDYDVRSGYKVEIGATKDLPLGYVYALLNLALSNQGEGEPDRTLTMPIYAVVGQGVVTVTPEVLLFKRPNLAEGDVAKINVTFIAPPAREEVTVESYEPKYLKVDKPEKGLDGKWRITAHIPANDPEAAKDQADPPMIGQVVLKVSGLDRPVTVKVKWNPQQE